MTTAIMNPPMLGGQTALATALARRNRAVRARAVALTLPLLMFLLLTLLVPIGALLLRAVQNPEVVHALPLTTQALQGWSHEAAISERP